MTTFQKWLLGTVIGGLAVLLVCAVLITRHLLPVIDSLNASATLHKANATLDAINAPCKGFHGSTTCGPLAQLSQTEKNVGIVAGQAALQVKQSAQLVNSATAAVNSASASVQNLASSAAETAQQATATLKTTETTVASLQAPISQSTALLASLTRTGDSATKAVDSFNTLISQPDLLETMENVQGITANGNAIAADFRKVADHETEEFLKPVKWYMQPVKKGSQLIDILAAVSRHTP